MMALFALLCWGVKAQDMNPSNNGNTPYSRYGYGRLAETSLTRNRAMGGVGVGFRSSQSTNPLNPASYTAIDSLTFLFDFGMNAQVARYSEDGEHQSSWNGGLDYITMQFPLGKYFAASMGLLPYSYVGYSYGSADSTLVTGTTDTYTSYTQVLSGDGGFNKVYFGLAAQPFKWMSLGVNAGYIYGEISNDFSVAFTDGTTTSTTSNKSMSTRALELQFGLQLNHTFAQKHNVTLGATYGPKMNMHVKVEDIQTTTAYDTIVNTKHTVSIPQTWGVGVSYVYDNRLTIAADYRVEQWADVEGIDDNLSVRKGLYCNTEKLALGAEYLPSLKSRNYFSRMRYRVGFNHSKSYVAVRGSRNDEYGFTAGLGFPLRNQKSTVNMAFEYVKVKPENKAFLSENYLQFNVGLTFNEFWFFKNKLK